MQIAILVHQRCHSQLIDGRNGTSIPVPYRVRETSNSGRPDPRALKEDCVTESCAITGIRLQRPQKGLSARVERSNSFMLPVR